MPLWIDEYTFRILFDDEFANVVENLESASPEAMCRTTDLPSDIAHGNELVFYDFQGTKRTYKVRGIEPDGQGMTRLILSET